MKKAVTVVVPLLDEAGSLPALLSALRKLAEEEDGYAWDFLFVDDGSADSGPEWLRGEMASDSRVSLVELSRNFGKESAMLAGLDYSSGDAVVVMDSDMQHPPGLISVMLRHWEQGYDDVYAKRNGREGDPWLRRVMTGLFYKLLRSSSRFEVLEDAGDFRLLDRAAVDALRQMRETERYTKGLFAWIGFRKKEVPYDVADRAAGESKWTYSRLVGLAIDGLTSFSTAPLRFASVVGVAVSLLSVLYMLWTVAKTLVWGDPVAGYPTLVSVVLLTSGIQLFALGIIGEYVGRIYKETKRRPPYVVRRCGNVKPK